MANRPEPEIAIDEALVTRLLQSQFPELAELPVRPLSRGWDNTNFRLGDKLAARLPHREVAAPLVEHEQRWLTKVAERVDLGVPAPTYHGTPNEEFPWPWSVVPFFGGGEAATATIDDPEATAATLGTFLRQLHIPADPGLPVNPYRGCALADRADSFATNHQILVDRGDPAAELLAQVFCDAAQVAPATEAVWLHGDLHLRNMIVDQGTLVAAIDWGDICQGDPATDLAVAYMLTPGHVDLVREHAGASAQDMLRAKGWAANFAAIYLARSDDDPVMHAVGTRLVERLAR
jgi:aminoglycoside phosphotransferase (APT) family kinase protein